MSDLDFSNKSYGGAGVDLVAQNETNKRIKQFMAENNMNSEGFFGGTADISDFKIYESLFLQINGESYDTRFNEDPQTAGKAAATQALREARGHPIGVLDYFASAGMGDDTFNFVKGVTLETIARKCKVLGGESAQMPETYREGMQDGFVHVLGLNQVGGGLNIAPLIKDMEKPLLVASTDGTGTKTKVSRNPKDIIYHGMNDVAAQGVKPVGFAMYIAGNVDQNELEEIDKKADEIAKELGVKKFDSIVMYEPDKYVRGDVDIAGTVVGLIDQKNIITGEYTKEGDVIIGLSVDGLMTNGSSLARELSDEIAKSKGVTIDDPIEELDGRTLRYEMSRPHRSMVDVLFGNGTVEGVLSKYEGYIKGTAHITGGGQQDNIPRMIPDGLRIEVEKDTIAVPPLMKLFMEYGLPEDEARATFNMGVGFTLTVNPSKAGKICDYINENFKYEERGVDIKKAEVVGKVLKRPPKFMYVEKR